MDNPLSLIILFAFSVVLSYLAMRFSSNFKPDNTLSNWVYWSIGMITHTINYFLLLTKNDTYKAIYNGDTPIPNRFSDMMIMENGLLSSIFTITMILCMACTFVSIYNGIELYRGKYQSGS